MIFGRAVIGGGEEDNAGQKKSQQGSQQPDGKLSLDHVTSVWILRKTRHRILSGDALTIYLILFPLPQTVRLPSS